MEWKFISKITGSTGSGGYTKKEFRMYEGELFGETVYSVIDVEDEESEENYMLISKDRDGDLSWSYDDIHYWARPVINL